MTRATTFDLQVLDLALTYEAHKMKKAQGQAPELTEAEMMEALKSVRKK